MSARAMPPLLIAAMASNRLEAFVVMILTAATGYYTYLGVSAIELNSDWLTKAGYALFATSVSAGLYLLWRALLSQVPVLTHRARWLAIPIVMFVIAIAIGVSTYFNLTGMIGPEAVRYNMESSLEGWSDATAKAVNQAHEGLEGASAIRLNRAKFQQMAEAERTMGRNTGAVGNGAIAGMLEQVATVMAAAARDADDKAVLAEKLGSDAEKSLGVMRSVVNDPTLPLQVKTARFATEAETLRLSLLQLSRLEVASIVRQAVAAVRETVKPALSDNRTVADRQKKLIEDLSQLLTNLDSLGQVARQAAPIPMLGKPFQAITVYTAVWLHWSDYIPATLAALSIDIFLLPLLGLKCLVATELNRTSGSDIAKRYVVAELLEMADLMAKLGLAAPVRQIVRAEIIPPVAPDSTQDRVPVIRTVPNRLD